MKSIIIILFITINLHSLFAQQNEAWFYIVAQKESFSPNFEESNDTLLYTGTDKKLKEVLNKYTLFSFKKTQRKASKKNLKKTFFVRANDEALLDDLLKHTSYLFISGVIISEEDKKIFEPNDYGLTSTIGENLGAQVNLDYYDFLGVPKAWYYTTGSPDIIIGISDGSIDTTDIEFKGKSKIIQNSSLSKGHGISVTESAAGQGNNAYAIAGVCYDCSIYSSFMGNLRFLEQLVELSNLGAKVINCSWGTSNKYSEAQESINKIYENGTIVVAAGHNPRFDKTKGKVFYYPASYEKVIAVSSAMHRYEKPIDNIKISKRGFYYAHNIKGFIGANAGFVDNDTLKKAYIYPASIKNINKYIDLVAPANGVYRYGEKSLNGFDDVSKSAQTSGVTPLITGTIGLMFSLYPCLPVDEVESILKITSWNIDHIKQNLPFAGMYGSGMLQTGDAVEMVYQLYNEKEIAYIDNQDFSRWDFKLTSLSKEIIIKNQKFRDSATLNLTSKNKIVIKENTVLKPGIGGSISLKINPNLEKECDLVLRDPSILED